MIETTNIRGQNYSPDICDKCGQRIRKFNNKCAAIKVECEECGKTYLVAPGAEFPIHHGRYMTEKEGDDHA